MTHHKTWAMIAALLVTSFMSVMTQASGLPEFTELVSENSDAVINISTTKKTSPRLTIGVAYHQG